MKKNRTKSRNRTPDIYSTDHSGPGAQNSTGATVDNGQTLADLVWKYFADEITEAVMEVEQALAPERSGPTKQASKRRQKGK
jgi:hypothetical protein